MSKKTITVNKKDYDIGRIAEAIESAIEVVDEIKGVMEYNGVDEDKIIEVIDIISYEMCGIKFSDVKVD